MIRRLREEDIPRIAEISVFGWRDTYRGIINDDILFSKISVYKRIKQFQKAFIEKTEETYVYDDGIIKAMLTLGKCRDEDKTEAFELWGIYVDPFMQEMGIGSQLMKFCEEEAIKRGHQEIILWTFEANKKASDFYHYQGYTLEGRKHRIEHLDAMEVRWHKML